MANTSNRSWTPWLVFAAVIVAGMVWRSMQSHVVTELIGQPLPPLAVTGWLQTDASPSENSLRGKLVLVDFWATWCPPCRANMSKVVQFAHRFRDQDLVVLGITPEDGPDVETVHQYVTSVQGLDWPIGYGAAPMMQMFGVEKLPTYVLFNRAGVSIWASHYLDGLDEIVIEELARNRQESKD